MRGLDPASRAEELLIINQGAAWIHETFSLQPSPELSLPLLCEEAEELMRRIFDFGGREVERSQTIAGEKGRRAKGANPQALEPILPVSRGSAARDSSPSASSDAGAPAALHVRVLQRSRRRSR